MQLSEGPVPLYHQLANELRQQIASGQLQPGDAIPTEDRLCEQYGVSRVTVRRAVDDLCGEKLVVRRRGVGTFVAEPGDAARSVSLVGSLYDALNYPQDISIEILKCGQKPSTKRIAKLLELPGDANVLEVEVMSRVHDTPFAATTFYIPSEIGTQIEFDKVGRGSPIARLIEQILNEPVTRAEQIVEPVSASAKLARLLEITRGTAILHVLRTYYTHSAKPVEVASVYYRPDQYSLQVELLAPPPNP